MSSCAESHPVFWEAKCLTLPWEAGAHWRISRWKWRWSILGLPPSTQMFGSKGWKLLPRHCPMYQQEYGGRHLSKNILHWKDYVNYVSQMNVSGHLPCSCCGHCWNTLNVHENAHDCGSDYVNDLKIGNIQASVIFIIVWASKDF